MRAAVLAVLVAMMLSVSGGARPPLRADRIVVFKARRELILYRGGVAVRTYRVALGGAPSGPKRCEGDDRTPEGSYVIDSRNERSRYHRSLHVSYPSPSDRRASHALGCRPGGEIMIHGITNGMGWIGAAHRKVDWTAGCIAVTDEEIDEIWRAVPNGTPVEIRP